MSTAAANYRHTYRPTPAGQAVVDAYYKLKATLPQGVEPSNYAIAAAVGLSARAVLYHRRKLHDGGHLAYRPEAVARTSAKAPLAPPPGPKLTEMERAILEAHPKLAATGPVWLSRMARHIKAHDESVGLAWRRLVSWKLLKPWDAYPGASAASIPDGERRSWRIDPEVLARERARKMVRGELAPEAFKSDRRRRRAKTDPRPKWSPWLSPKEACDVMRNDDRKMIRRRRRLLAKGGAA